MRNLSWLKVGAMARGFFGGCLHRLGAMSRTKRLLFGAWFLLVAYSIYNLAGPTLAAVQEYAARGTSELLELAMVGAMCALALSRIVWQAWMDSRRAKKTSLNDDQIIASMGRRCANDDAVRQARLLCECS